MPVYEFLTLTDLQASALVDACQNVWFIHVDNVPESAHIVNGLDGSSDTRQAIALQLQDMMADRPEDEHTAIRDLIMRVTALTTDQGEELRVAIGRFWELAGDDWGRAGKELFTEVGLV